MALCKFDIPVEREWVKRVFVAHHGSVNTLFDEICNNEAFRNIQVMSVSGSGEILVTYEAAITVKKEEVK